MIQMIISRFVQCSPAPFDKRNLCISYLKFKIMTILLAFDFNSNLEALNNCALSAPSTIISWFTASSQPRSATTMIVAAEHQYLTDLFKRHQECDLRPPDASKVISVIASDNSVQLFRCIATYYCLHGPRFGFQPGASNSRSYLSILSRLPTRRRQQWSLPHLHQQYLQSTRHLARWQCLLLERRLLGRELGIKLNGMMTLY